VGFTNPGRFYSGLRRQKWKVAAAIIPRLVSRPWLLGAVVRNYLWAGDIHHGGSETAELASIAVTPRASGTGVGRALLNEFVAASEEANATQVSLTTDAIGNDRVCEFYERAGFRNVGSTEGRTRPMVMYTLTLPDRK